MKTDRPLKLEVNCTTGEEKYIELTDEEIAQMQADAEAALAAEEARRVEAEAKAAIRASAEAKLAALGLTPEEIAVLS